MKLSKYEVDRLNIIRDEVNRYLKSTNLDTSGIESCIKRILPKIMLGKRFDVVMNDIAKRPFIMSIYPDIKELNKKSEDLIKIMEDPKSNNEEFVSKWCEIEHWYVEIDSRILNRMHRLCVDDGEQFVAILCHEIGHVMNENPISLFYNFKKNRDRFDMFERMMLSENKIVRKLILPMFVHTSQFRIIVENLANMKNGNKIEMAADAYVPEEYQGALISYIDNHLLNNPDTTDCVQDREQFNNDQQVAIRFSKESIYLLKERRDVLKRQIQTQYNSPNTDNYGKHMMKFIGKHITCYNPETDKTNLISEGVLENGYLRDFEQCMEKAEAILESTRVNERDITVLEIQAENIHTPEDKLYIIHTIYDYMEFITKENAKKIKKVKKVTDNIQKELLKDSRLQRLEALRDKVMAVKVSDNGDRYGLFVKYPEGYEG